MTNQIPARSARPRRRTPRCPICRAPAATEWKPFCSRRCSDADLGNWLAGNYRIASAEDDATDAGEVEADDGDPPSE